MANKKITDATTATSLAGTDKVFLNQGGDLKQVDLNSAVANSQAVQTLNSNLVYNEGDKIIVNGISILSGYISSNQTEIVFSIVLDKQISNKVKTISCVITDTTIRGIQGYLLNTIDLSKRTDYTIITEFYKNIVRIKICLKDNKKWDNAVNNTPLSIMTNLTLTLS